MRRYFVIATLFVLAVLAACGLLYLLMARPVGNWRQVSLSFNGYTNSSAVISIRNTGPTSVVLRDHFELEFVGVAPPTPVPGLTNLIIAFPTGTNLVVAPSRQADLLVAVPTQGQHWIARLEFAPAGIKTRLGEYLIRRQDWWAKPLPGMVRGVPVHVVSQEFSK